jgi:uncharacterized protein (DUF2236 family)
MSGTLFPDDVELQTLLVGPGSVTWRFASDPRLYLGSLYPLLLQVSHPTVGAGVRDFSNYEERPWDRLVRTIDYVNLLVYGGADAAAAGRRLRALHKGFQGRREDGERYYALEPRAYAWVHATLLEGYVRGHAQFGRPMTRGEIDTFYREYRGLGRLVGVRDGDLPDSWGEFRDYFDTTVREELRLTESVTRLLHSVRNAAPPVPLPDALWRVLRTPAHRAAWVAGIGLMAPALRARLGIGWDRRDERAFRALGTLSRGLTPVMPERLQVMGPGSLRLRRRAIARGPLGPGSGSAAAPSERVAA